MNKHLLHHIIRQHAATHGHTIAVSAGGAELSYAALDKNANQLAHALIQAGLRRGDRAGVYMTACVEYIIAITAIMKAGGIFLPLDAAYPQNRISSFIAEANPGIILTLSHSYQACINCCDAAHNPAVFTVSHTTHAFSITTPANGETYNALPETDPGTELDGDDANYLLFTSGSTGKPKGIEGRHKSLSHFVHWEMKQFALGTDTRISLLAPITFDVSLRDIFVPLAAGGTVCIPGEKEKQEPGHFLQWLHSEGITLIHCVPSFLRLLIAALQDTPALKDCLLTVQHILVAGEPLYGKDVNAWKALVGNTPALVNLYGPSETTLAKLFFPVNGKPFADGAIIPLGQPVANTVALVIKEQALCTTGEEGEIMIKTPFMTRGYYNNDLLNKEKFIQNPLHNDFDDIVFRTGDLGYYDDDNLIHFTGRADDMIKFNGNRIELAELQKTALQYPDIREAVALTRGDAGGQEQLVLFFTAVQPVAIPALQQHFGLQLPGYMHPALFVQLEQLPVNPNGKTDRAALAAMELKPAESGEALTDETEISIGQIWKELLKVEQVTRSMSFFQAGGSSLKAIQMISKIYKQRGVLLNVREIMAHPTVPGIKTLIMDKLGVNTPAPATTAATDATRLPVIQQQVLHWSATDDGWMDFNMPYAYHIQGALNTALLQKAITRLGEAYTFFRQGLHNSNGYRKNIILSDILPDYSTIDALGKTADDIHKQLLALAREPFAREETPMARFRLLVTGADQYIFLFVTHLSVSDGVTAQGWVKELWGIYQGLLNNTPYDTAIPGNTALLSREQQEGGKQAAYWKTIYEKRTPAGLLPEGKAFSSGELQSHAFAISAAAYRAWDAVLAATGTTLQFFLLAAAERAIASLLNGKPFTYHAVISDRGNYTPGTAGNLLYYVPFTVQGAIPAAAAHLLHVKEGLLLAMDRLPLPVDTQAARPEIVINIAPGQEGGSGENTGIEVMPYTRVLHRERFPVNISVTMAEDAVHISVDHIPSNVNFGAGFENAFRQAADTLCDTRSPSQS